MDDESSQRLIPELQGHSLVGFDLDGLRRIIEEVAVLCSGLFDNDGRAGLQAINADGTGTVGDEFTIGVSDDAAITIGHEKLGIRDGSARHCILFRNEQGTHFIVSEDDSRIHAGDLCFEEQ